MEMKMVKELLLQSLEHEMGGVNIYATALKCAVNEELKEEWEKYHEETQKHVQILQDVCVQMQLDPQEQTPGRKITHDKGEALVASMEAALGTGDKEAAQCVACEAVTVAELIDMVYDGKGGWNDALPTEGKGGWVRTEGKGGW